MFSTDLRHCCVHVEHPPTCTCTCVHVPCLFFVCFSETGSPAFDEFLALLGQKVRMKGFTKYRAQLDHKGEHYLEFTCCFSFLSIAS